MQLTHSQLDSAGCCAGWCVCCAHLDVRDARDGEHAADEEAGQDVVVVQVVTQPHLDLGGSTHKRGTATGGGALAACSLCRRARRAGGDSQPISQRDRLLGAAKACQSMATTKI